MTRIESGTFADHAALTERIHQGIELLGHVGHDLEFGDAVDFYDTDIVKYAQFQSLQLQTVLELNESDRYMEAFTIIRNSFEHFFWLLLASQGFIFVRRIYIPEGQRDRFDQIRENLQEEISNGQGVEWVNDRPQRPDHIDLVLRGLYKEDDPDRQPIPWYYFVVGEYRHELAFLQDLETIRVGHGFIDEEQLDELRAEQNFIYRQFINFEEGIRRKLDLNDLASEEDIERLRAHYSFLSTFAHSMPTSIETILGNHQSAPYYRPSRGMRRFDHYISELVLLYVLRLLQYYIRLIVNHPGQRFTLQNADTYQEFIDDVDEYAQYFWLVYEEPHRYDHFRRRSRDAAQDKGDVREIYYEDPIDRLKGLHQTRTELLTGEVFRSPFDAQ